jgi:hypothetical protein
MLFSLAPAAQLMRGDLTGSLKEGASNIARGRHRLRSALVVGQITLGLVLLTGAELLMASFVYLARRDPGFRPDHLLTFEISQTDAQTVTARTAFYERLIERLRATPGVRAVATGMPLPLQGHQMTVSFDIVERPAAPSDRPHGDMAIVTPGYFSAMGIPLRRGRDFSEQDDAKAPRVIVVNEAFARKYFPGQEAIGKRIKPGRRMEKKVCRCARSSVSWGTRIRPCDRWSPTQFTISPTSSFRGGSARSFSERRVRRWKWSPLRARR